METATAIVTALRAVPGCLRCDYAGSLRRMREIIGDVDILAAQDSGLLMDTFTAQPQVAEVIARGPTKTSVRTTAGLQADLRVPRRIGHPRRLPGLNCGNTGFAGSVRGTNGRPTHYDHRTRHRCANGHEK